MLSYSPLMIHWNSNFIYTHKSNTSGIKPGYKILKKASNKPGRQRKWEMCSCKILHSLCMFTQTAGVLAIKVINKS